MFKTFLTLPFALLIASSAMADIYQWQWVDPKDHSLGKVQSNILCPDGAGISAAPQVFWKRLDLSQAYLFRANLSDGFLNNVNLSNAYLSQSNLTDLLCLGCRYSGADLSQVNAPHFYFDQGYLDGADLTGATLTNIRIQESKLDNANFINANLSNSSINFSTFSGANLTGATIKGLLLEYATDYGLTATQIYSTGSYKNHDLQGLRLDRDDLTGWDFSGQNLSNATFHQSTLPSARFTNATLTFAQMDLTDLRNADFAGASFSRTSMDSADLTNANLAGTDLSQVVFGIYATFTGTNMTGARIAGAQFSSVGSNGLTAAQIYSTASYQAHDLRNIIMDGDMPGWDFSGQNLTNASIGGFGNLASANFSNANLTNATIAGSLQGADFSGAIVVGASIGPLTAQQLYSTASYQAHDLHGISLGGDMRGWDFSDVNLTNANFGQSLLSQADFTGATVAGMNFSRTTDKGFTASQLYSTASYQAHNLAGVIFSDDDVRGWNLAGVNLSNSRFMRSTIYDVDFTGANLTGADFTASDMRGSRNAAFDQAITTNTIRPDGTVAGLHHNASTLFIRNYVGSPAIPIRVTREMVMNGDSLVILFDDRPWGSTISFDPGIPVLLDGSGVFLDFAPGIDASAFIGTTYRLFDWTGVTPQGHLRVYSQFYKWDASHFDTDGTVTLIGVPEPSSVVSGAIIVSALAFRLSRQRSSFLRSCRLAE